MLALAHGWARVMGIRLHVVTIDHGLRDASAAEATMVAAECAALGHPHATLRWHWDGQGNLQDAARAARLRLIDGWRADRGWRGCRAWPTGGASCREQNSGRSDRS
jgi:tRNA(Ile)-lysidine synthase